MSRGDWIVTPGSAKVHTAIPATLAWLDTEPAKPGRSTGCATATAGSRPASGSIDSVLDIHKPAAQDAHELPVNAIGKVTMECSTSCPSRPFASNRVGGALIVVDPPATAPAARCSWTSSRRRPRKTGKAGTSVGKVLFVGAGPGGRPHHRARRAAPAKAEVVLYDAPADAELRKRATRAGSMSASAASSTRPNKARSTPCWSRPRASTAWCGAAQAATPASFGRLEEELIALAEAGLDCGGRPRRHRRPRRRRHAAPTHAAWAGRRSACPRP